MNPWNSPNMFRILLGRALQVVAARNPASEAFSGEENLNS